MARKNFSSICFAGEFLQRTDVGFFFLKFLFTGPILSVTRFNLFGLLRKYQKLSNFSVSAHIRYLVVVTLSGGREGCRSPSIGHESQLQGLHLHDASSPKGRLLNSCPVIRLQGRNPEDPFRLQQYLCFQMANVIFYESRWVPRIFRAPQITARFTSPPPPTEPSS